MEHANASFYLTLDACYDKGAVAPDVSVAPHIKSSLPHLETGFDENKPHAYEQCHGLGIKRLVLYSTTDVPTISGSSLVQEPRQSE